MTWLMDLYRRGSVSEVWKHESTPNVLWGFIAVCLWEILVTISRLELLLEWIIEFYYALLRLFSGEREPLVKFWAHMGEWLSTITANLLWTARLFLEQVYERGSVVGYGSAFLIYYLWKSLRDTPTVDLESTVSKTGEEGAEATLTNVEKDRNPGWKIRLHRAASERITYIFPGWFSRSLNRALELILTNGTRDQAATVTCLVVLNAIHWKLGAVEHHIPRANGISMCEEAFIGFFIVMREVGWLWSVFAIVIGFTNYCVWSRNNIGAAVGTVFIAYCAQLPWAISLRHTDLRKYVPASDKHTSKSRLVFNIISVLVGCLFAYSVMWTVENFFGESTSSSMTGDTTRANDTTTDSTSGGPNPKSGAGTGAAGETLVTLAPETCLNTADGIINSGSGARTFAVKTTNAEGVIARPQRTDTTGSEEPRKNSFLKTVSCQSCCMYLGWAVAVLAIGLCVLHLTSTPEGQISKPVFPSSAGTSLEDRTRVHENGALKYEGEKSTSNYEEFTDPQDKPTSYSEEVYEATTTKKKLKSKQSSTTASTEYSKRTRTRTPTSPDWKKATRVVPTQKPAVQSSTPAKQSKTKKESASSSSKRHRTAENPSITSSQSTEGSKQASAPSSTPHTTPIYDDSSLVYGWDSEHYADAEPTRVHNGVYSGPTQDCQNGLCSFVVGKVDLIADFISYRRFLNLVNELQRMIPTVWSSFKDWNFSWDAGTCSGDCFQSLSMAAFTFTVIFALWWAGIVSIVYNSPLGFLVDIVCSVPVLWSFWWIVGWEKVGSSLQGDSSWRLCLGLFLLEVGNTVISQATYWFCNEPPVTNGTISRPSALLTVIVPVTTRVNPSFRPNMERMLRSGAFRIYIISNSLETWNSVQQALYDVGNVGNWHNYNYHDRNPAVIPGEMPTPPASPRPNASTPATLQQCITYGLYLKNDMAPQRTLITAVSTQEAVWNDDFLPSALSYFEDRSVSFLGVSCAGVRVRYRDNNGNLRFKESCGNFLQCMEMDRKAVECVSANRIDGCIPQLASSVWFFQTASLFERRYITEGQFVTDEGFFNWMGKYLIKSGYKLRWYNPNEEERYIREHQDAQGWRQYATAIGRASCINWSHRLSMLFDRKMWRHHPWTLFSYCFFPMLDKTPVLLFFFLACRGFYASGWRLSQEVFNINGPTVSGCALLILWLLEGGITRGGFKACRTAWQLASQARRAAQKNNVRLQTAQRELDEATTALTNARNDREAGRARLRPLQITSQQSNVTKSQHQAFVTENEAYSRLVAGQAAAQGRYDAAVPRHEAAQTAAGTIGARSLGIPARVWRLIGWELLFGTFAVVVWPMFTSMYEARGLFIYLWVAFWSAVLGIVLSILELLAIVPRSAFLWVPICKASLRQKWVALNDRVMDLFEEDALAVTATAAL